MGDSTQPLRKQLSPVAALVGIVGAAVALTTLLVDAERSAVVWGGLGVGAIGVLVSVALDPGGVGRFLGARATRFGANASFSVLVFAALLVGVNFVAARNPRKVDLTRDQLFTLAPQTLKVLGDLKKPLQIRGFFSPDRERDPVSALRSLCDNFSYHAPLVSCEIVDPARNPLLVKKYDLTSEGPRVVVEYGEQQSRVTKLDEESLTNALIKVTRERRRKIYVESGHGGATFDGDPGTAEEGMRSAVDRIRAEGFDVEALSLVNTQTLPDDAEALIVAASGTPLVETEVRLVESYLRRGGSVAVLLEPGQPTGLEPLLTERWGVKIGADLVIDPRSRLGLQVPIIDGYGAHPIVADFREQFCVMPDACSVDMGPAPDGVHVNIVASGSQSSGSYPLAELRTMATDKGAQLDLTKVVRGPISVAVAATRTVQPEDVGSEKKWKDETRLVVFGDSDFARNRAIGLGANADLFLNAINWLAESEDLISIRPRARETSRLSMSPVAQRMLFASTIVLLPLVLLFLSAWVYHRKRTG